MLLRLGGPLSATYVGMFGATPTQPAVENPIARGANVRLGILVAFARFERVRDVLVVVLDDGERVLGAVFGAGAFAFSRDVCRHFDAMLN